MPAAADLARERFHLLTCMAVAALLPLLPLVPFKYPLADLLAKFFGMLAGG